MECLGVSCPLPYQASVRPASPELRGLPILEQHHFSDKCEAPGPHSRADHPANQKTSEVHSTASEDKNLKCKLCGEITSRNKHQAGLHLRAVVLVLCGFQLAAVATDGLDPILSCEPQTHHSPAPLSSPRQLTPCCSLA